jgi:D-glycero-D-manno-heptose 1,7-bisphosphate phosphatase
MDTCSFKPRLRSAAFIDRDGVINREKSYVHQSSDFEWLPGVFDALRIFQNCGYALVIVTNQAGIARGYYDEATYLELCAYMQSQFALHDLVVSIYHCPHHPTQGIAPYKMQCDCRKPAPGMIFKAADELGLSLKHSFMVGDKISDVQAGRAAGLAQSFLVKSGHPITPEHATAADAVYDDLLHLASSGVLGRR